MERETFRAFFGQQKDEIEGQAGLEMGAEVSLAFVLALWVSFEW